MNEDVEPDAWLSKSGQNCITDSEKRCLEIEGHTFEDPESLFSSSTIQDGFRGECPYCANTFSFLPVHRMQCVAEQVLSEQLKSLEGIKDEIEKGQDSEEVVEMLEHYIDSAMSELSDSLSSEQEEIQNLEVFSRQ
jgi:DNA relaxase NicK